MRPRGRSALGLAGLVVAAGGLAACGYALVGRGITTDPSIKRIGVPLFKDRTGKPGLDQKITTKVISELLKRGRFDVVQEATWVDAVVDGEILAYNVVPIGFSGAAGQNLQASRYAVTVTAKITYSKVGEKEPIWANDSFSFRDETDVGDDAQSFFDREDQVLERLGESFARSLVAAMLEAF
jgi:hypothetical protein